MPPFTPSSTGPDVPTLVQRQSDSTVTVISQGNSGGGGGGECLSGGGIAGIVLGTIVGTLLILWVIRSCMNYNKPMGEPVEKVRYEPSPYHHHRSRSSRRRSRRPSRTSVDEAVIDGPPAIYYSEAERGQRGPKIVYDSRGRR